MQVSSPFQTISIETPIKSEDSPCSQITNISSNNTTTITATSSSGSNNITTVSTVNWTESTQDDVKPSVTVSTVTSTQVTPTVTVQTLKRPLLVVCSHEDPHDELVMEGLLYDYTFLNTSAW